MGNPIEILYSWQALLVALSASGLTQLVKTVHDVLLGAEARKSSAWLNRVLFPMVPIIFGTIIGTAVPLRPEVLVEYVAAHAEGWFGQNVIYAIWGAACGQFADYTFTKVKSAMKAFAGGSAEVGDE